MEVSKRNKKIWIGIVAILLIAVVVIVMQKEEQFAAKVGVTFSTVNRWENGRGRPSPLAMRRIEELRSEVMNKK